MKTHSDVSRLTVGCSVKLRHGTSPIMTVLDPEYPHVSSNLEPGPWARVIWFTLNHELKEAYIKPDYLIRM